MPRTIEIKVGADTKDAEQGAKRVQSAFKSAADSASGSVSKLTSAVSGLSAAFGALAGIAFGDPGHWIWWTVGFSLALGIVGATLDLVLDGWRITSVRPPEKQAVLSSWTEIGWRRLRPPPIAGNAGANRDIRAKNVVNWSSAP